MFTYLFDRFLRRVFSLLRADGLYFIYISGLKVWVLLLVQDSFRFLYPVFRLHLFTTTSVPKLIFFCPISAYGKKVPLPFYGSSQSFSFYLLPSPVRRFFGTTISLTRSQSPNICWLSLWPTFFTFSDRPWGIDLYYYFSF